jgi:hypothetical protein
MLAATCAAASDLPQEMSLVEAARALMEAILYRIACAWMPSR